MATDQSRSYQWALLSLLFLGMLAFWRTAGFDFLNWDDPAYVLHNDLIKSWHPSNLYGVATQTVTRNYAPLTILSLLVDHTLWGLNPAGYHITNVLLHLVNGVLVFCLVRRLSNSSFVAWSTAALFLIHPVQIETVAWISSRKGLLSATFILSALLVRLKPHPDASDDMKYMLWLAAALLSKALAVVVPAIVLLYDVLVRRKSFSEALVRQFVPGILCLLLLLKTMASQHTILGGIRTHFDYSLWHIVAIDTTIMWRYVGMMLWPSDLCVLYNPPTVDIWKTIAMATFGWSCVGGFLWKNRRQQPLILWAAVSYVLLLFPVLNFFRITTLMNDRYLYLPCIVFFALLTAAVDRLVSNFASWNTFSPLRYLSGARWLVAITAVTAAFLATNTYLFVWKDPGTLWTYAMTQAPELPVVRIQMAHTEYARGNRRQAIITLQRTLLECEPDDLDRKRIARTIEEWTNKVASSATGDSHSSL